MLKKRQSHLRLIRRAVEERSYLLKISDVLGYSVGFREKEGKRTDEPALVVYVRKGRKEKDPNDFPPHQRIPRRIRLTINGETIWLAVDLVESETGELCGTATSQDVTADILSGYSVCNRDSPNNMGTIGWLARRQANNEPVICGSFHVLLRFSQSDYKRHGVELVYQHNQNHPEYVLSPRGENDSSDPRDRIGTVLRGKRNQRVDIAIASVLTDKRPVPYVNLLGPMGEIRNLREQELDPENPITVFISGHTSRRAEGIILEYPAFHEFQYPDRSRLMMLGLIATDIATQPGDSGALLVDESLRPMGMLIGRADRRSFFMHIRNMCRDMRLKEFSTDV